MVAKSDRTGVPSWVGKIRPNFGSDGLGILLSNRLDKMLQKPADTAGASFGVPASVLGAGQKPGWQSVLEQDRPTTDEQWRAYNGALDQMYGLVNKGDPYAIKYKKWRDEQLAKPVAVGG